MSGTPATKNIAANWRASWILDGWRDTLLIIATPLLIFPALYFAAQRASAIEILVFVTAFGGVGHHLPGLMRAYGDSELFRRFRWRFILAPIFFVSLCAASAVWDLSGVLLTVILWSIWHMLMQTYGFVRIYQSKSQNDSGWGRRLDYAMCLTWFIGGVMLSPARLLDVLRRFYEAGGPEIPPGVIQDAVAVTPWVIGVVTMLFLAKLAQDAVQGRPQNPLKLLLMGTTFGFWWLTNSYVPSILLGIAMFEVFHDVQYLAIVWAFNRRRVESGAAKRGFTGWLFRRGLIFVGMYLGLILAYGGAAFATTTISRAQVRDFLLGVWLASTLLHYYYDGFIWKLREKETSAALDLKSSAAARPAVASFSWHGAGWAMLIVAVIASATIELRSEHPGLLARHRLLAESVPNYAPLRSNLGLLLANEGRLAEAEVEFLAALDADANHYDSRFHLAICKQLTGRAEEAENDYRRLIDEVPDRADARCNLAAILIGRGELEEATDLCRKALEIDERIHVAHTNMAAIFRRRNQLDIALKHEQRAKELLNQVAQENADRGRSLYPGLTHESL